MTWSGSTQLALLIGLLLGAASLAAAQHTDIQIQTQGGKIVAGAGTVSDDPGNATLGINFQERVFGDGLGSNFRSLNPGFNSLETGNSLLLPSGVQGFTEGVEFEFDLLPMTIGSTSTNFAYWDGLGEVDFGAPPADTTWSLSVREGFGRIDFIADGSDTVVPGGVVGEVSDLNRLHQHQRLEVETVGGDEQEGVYLVSMQLRVAGFETSDPIFLAHYSFNTPTAIGGLAQDWVRDNYFLLTNSPGDYNGDGFVDAADYTVWRDAEAPLDGSPEQYAVWQANYGASDPGSPASAVPEPAAWLLFCLAGVAIPRRR